MALHFVLGGQPLPAARARRHHGPLTAAGVLMYDSSTDQIILVQKKSDGCYGTASGFIEKGETAKVAAYREWKEETRKVYNETNSYFDESKYIDTFFGKTDSRRCRTFIGKANVEKSCRKFNDSKERHGACGEMKAMTRFPLAQFRKSIGVKQRDANGKSIYVAQTDTGRWERVSFKTLRVIAIAIRRGLV